MTKSMTYFRRRRRSNDYMKKIKKDHSQLFEDDDVIDVSRIKKNIFSNPFHQKKLGLAMSQTCFHRQLKRNYVMYPEIFALVKEGLKEKTLFCVDPDCSFKTCHKKVIENFLNKKV